MVKYLVVSLPKMLRIHSIHAALANPSPFMYNFILKEQLRTFLLGDPIFDEGI